MNNNQRSKQYDWFKGSSSNKNDKNFKGNLKTTWKFTKIFLIFFIVFTSLWGCAQIFIVRKDAKIGSGVELYSSTNQISPAASSIHISSGKNNTYNLDPKADNIWINNKENDELMKDIRAEFKIQGLNNLGDANKGGNIVARLVLDGKELKANEKGAVRTTSGAPLVISSATNKAPSFKNPFTSPFPVQLYEKDEKTKTIKPMAGPKGKLDISTITPDPEKEAAWAFNTQFVYAILNSINNKGVKPLENQLLNKPLGDEELIAQTKMIFDVYSILGLDYDETTHLWKFNGVAYSLPTSSKYVPISSWGEAWSMKRGGGPFYGIFVYPISYITNKLIESLPLLHGWETLLTIVFVVVIISILSFSFTFKSLLQQAKMQELSAKKAMIDAKYEAYKGNKQMEMRQKQEVQELYKKNNINPLSSLGNVFITMPLFLSMYGVIGSIQHIKGTVWLGINFAATSYKELFAGNWQYLWIMILAAGVQVLSHLYPRLLNKRRDKTRINVHQKNAMKKSNKTQNIMLAVFTFMALIFQAGLQIYFIIRGLWRIAETTITHHIIATKKKTKIKNKKLTKSKDDNVEKIPLFKKIKDKLSALFNNPNKEKKVKKKDVEKAKAKMSVLR